jgi:PAS domain S-box-containing protein
VVTTTGAAAGATGGPASLATGGLDADELFELAMTHAAIGMAVTDVDGRIIAANPALSELLGDPHDELTSMTLHELTHPDEVGPELELWRALADGRTERSQLERRFLRADGSVVWAAVSHVAVRDGTGRLRCHLVQIQDVTARKDAERRLRETMAALRRSNETLTDFAAAAAHDLKSPLVNAHSLLEVLWLETADGLGASERELIDRARDRLRQLAERVDGLLRTAAAAGGHLVVDGVEVAAVIAGVLGELGGELHGLDVILEPCPPVRADPGALQLVVQNLLVNATAHGARKVRVHGTLVDDGSVEVCFDDDGPGFDPALGSRVLDTSVKEPASAGVGLGLVICSRIVERHGGSLGIGDAPEGGARVWFSLPAGETA